jgi:type IV pilus assembly protein PilC
MIYTYAWKNEDSEGVIKAKNIYFAKALLAERNITASSLKKQNFIAKLLQKNKTHSNLNSIILSQLFQLLKSGISIQQAFNMIQKNSTDSPAKKLCSTIEKFIKEGHTLSQALNNFPNTFDHITLALIHVAEQTGNLESILEKIIKQQTKHQIIKKQMAKALLYPCIVIITALIATVILLVFVIPQMQSMYDNFDAELPWITQTVIHASQFLRHNIIWLILAFALALISLIKYYRKSFRLKFFVHTLLLRTPKIKTVIQKSSLCFNAQIISVMLHAGIPILDAISLLKGTCKNLVYQKAWGNIGEKIKNGHYLSDSLKQEKHFPSLFISYIHIGENSGRLDEMLNQIALHYENDLNHFVDKLNLLLEPIIMLILGAIIGTLIIAMYLPLFKLGQVL